MRRPWGLQPLSLLERMPEMPRRVVGAAGQRLAAGEAAVGGLDAPVESAARAEPADVAVVVTNEVAARPD